MKRVSLNELRKWKDTGRWGCYDLPERIIHTFQKLYFDLEESERMNIRLVVRLEEEINK